MGERMKQSHSHGKWVRFCGGIQSLFHPPPRSHIELSDLDKGVPGHDARYDG